MKVQRPLLINLASEPEKEKGNTSTSRFFKRRLVRAEIFSSIFAISAPRKAPTTHFRPKILLPSLGQSRSRAQKEKTFTIDLVIQHQTSQKILAQASLNPNFKTFLSKIPSQALPTELAGVAQV